MLNIFMAGMKKKISMVRRKRKEYGNVRFFEPARVLKNELSVSIAIWR